MTTQTAASFTPVVSAALAEDGADSDVTSSAIVPPSAIAQADIVVRSGGVLAGLAIATLAFHLVDPAIRCEMRATDGDVVKPGTAIARVAGRARSLLAAERVALNFLGRMCGIATRTWTFVDAVRDISVRICDTRKTTPNLRPLERYAVRAGGGYNHRFNLTDAILIKDNHLAAVGSVEKAVEAARANAPPNFIIEVECESLEQVKAAVKSGVDAVLLDNMALERMRQAVAIARGHAVTEASGGITLENVRDVAKTGVDLISVGALTHSAGCADVALDFV